MEISGPLNLIPASRPPPTFETYSRRIVEQTPRTFPAAMPALPKPQQREEPRPRLQNLPAPRVPSDIPRSEQDMSLWKLTREFNDIGNIYQQPENNTPPYQQQQQQEEGLPRQPAQFQQQPNYYYPGSMAYKQQQQQQQRETVPIGYDPSYRTQTGLPLQEPEPEQTRMPAPRSPQPQLQVPQAVRADSAAAQPAEGYSLGWITAEAPNELTDAAYYDRDADDGSGAEEVMSGGGGMYTYGGAAAATVAEKMGHYAPEVVAVDPGYEQEEFEQPRQVPYDHRKTRVVLKEDVDFYMALLGGQEPPPASMDTQTLLQEEQEVRRRSQETEVQQSSRRRQEELQDTQSDVDFWVSLMQKA